TEVSDGFVQPDHALLDDVFPVCSDQEVGTCFSSDKVLVLVDQVFQGLIVGVPSQLNDFLIAQALVHVTAPLVGINTHHPSPPPLVSETRLSKRHRFIIHQGLAGVKVGGGSAAAPPPA